MLELGFNGVPLHWPLNPTGPAPITIAVASSNLPTDKDVAPPFTLPLPPSFLPLLTAAEQEWESLANISFVRVPDYGSTVDIRVGVSALNGHLGLPKTMGFIGYTEYHFTASNQFKTGTTVAIEDPAERHVVLLPNGDWRYHDSYATVFQDLLHEIGHALGLGHNPTDETSIMYPILSDKNRVPDAQDVAAIQSLYGAPTMAVVYTSPNDQLALTNLTA